ncbi:hypothetical protein [Lishizhenia sp.]|uniref:hypothetical protein n=1 Tax=Lishizhenia sp. TaxID=2497594 RepID=UPI00299F37C8|nr:hypothetical protein [Lishizhenia sp.]
MHMKSTVSPAPNFNIGYSHFSEKGNLFGFRLNFYVPNFRLGYQLDLKEGHNFVDENGTTLHLVEDEMDIYSGQVIRISPEAYVQRIIDLKPGGSLAVGGGLMLWFNEGNSLGEQLAEKYLPSGNGEEKQLYSLTQDAHQYITPFFPSIFGQLDYHPNSWPHLSFNVRYNYSYFDRVYGSYKLLNLGYTSSGSFTQSYSYLSLGLRYNVPFKKIRQRFEYLRKIDEETGLSNNQLERKIVPGTWAVKAGLGIGSLHDRTLGEKNDIRSGGNATPVLEFGVEKALKKHWLWFGRYSTYKYTRGWITNSSAAIPTRRMAKQSAHEISLGIGYSIVGPKNYNYLNINAGLSFGSLNNSLGDTTAVLDEVNMNSVSTGNVWYVQYNTLNLKNNYTTINVGLSKDLKLGKKLYLNFAYHYQIGLYKNSQTNYYYYKKGS